MCPDRKPDESLDPRVADRGSRNFHDQWRGQTPSRRGHSVALHLVAFVLACILVLFACAVGCLMGGR